MMIKKKLLKCLPFLSLFSLVFIRYLYYGFQYFYQLDDYIQYHNYTFFTEDIRQAVLELGLLTARPAAGLADVYVWSCFFSVMLLAVGILSAMYTVSALLLKRIFTRHFAVGSSFLVLFALLPLGFEGTYWVSASSRIICSLFFAALAAWLLQCYFDADKWYLLAGALVIQLLSCCFYEQGLIFSVVLFALLGIFNVRAVRWKALWGGFGIVNTVLYFVLTGLFPGTALYGSRMNMILPDTSYYFEEFLPQVLDQLYSAFVEGGSLTLIKGFWRGLQIMWQDKAVFFTLILIALCGLFGFVFSRQKRREDAGWMPLLWGAILFLAPLAPFFVLENTWFSLRGTVMSFAGLGLMVDCLLGKFIRGKASAIVAASLALIFCIAGVSELHDYKLTTENDQKVGQAIIEQADLFDAEKKIGILGIEPSALEEQNYFYHEHIHGVTESNWALTGYLRYRTKNLELAAVYPLPADAVWQSWNFETNRLDNFDLVYFYNAVDNKLCLLEVTVLSDTEYQLYYEGALFGTVTEENKIGKLHLQ